MAPPAAHVVLRIGKVKKPAPRPVYTVPPSRFAQDLAKAAFVSTDHRRTAR